MSYQDYPQEYTPQPPEYPIHSPDSPATVQSAPQQVPCPLPQQSYKPYYPQTRKSLIFSIALKDISASKLFIIGFLIIFLVLFFLMMIPAGLISRASSSSFVWNDWFLNIFYGLAIFLDMIVVIAVFSSLCGEEIKKRTIQSLTLYPVDIVDITCAKLMSTAVVSLICASFLFFGIFLPFIVYGVFPGPAFFVIFIFAYLITIFIITTGAFAINIFYYGSKLMKITPSGFSFILLIGALLLTQNALFAQGIIVLNIRSGITHVPLTPDDISGVFALAASVSLLSPYHSGGRILSNILGISFSPYDLYIFIPAIMVIILGIILGKRIYPDIFIRD